MKKLTIEVLRSLPMEVQDRVEDVLKAYNECSVVFEDGVYRCGDACLKSNYSDDHKTYGTILSTDLYTEDEIIENYINIFADYPIQYKGKREYELLTFMRNNRSLQGKLIDGNFILN